MKKHKKHDHEEHIDESWLIPYADLLTLLLALFIVLFASSQIDQKKFEQLSRSLNIAFHGGESVFLPSAVIPLNQSGMDKDKDDSEFKTAGETESNDENPPEQQQQQNEFDKETQDLEELKKQIDEYIEVNGLTTQLKTGLDKEELKISISDNALFASGSADVRTEARVIAEAISDLLVEYPGYEIVVSGHTDNLPIRNSVFADNWDLSSKRSLNFMKILLSNDQLNEARFSTVGYGEHHPIAPNDTAAGRAQNRRVEVSVLRNIPAEETGSTDDQATEQAPAE